MSDRPAPREDWQQDLFHHIRVGVVVHDASGRILAANATAGELLAQTVDDLHGRAADDPCWALLDRDGHRMSPEAYPVQRVIADQRPVQDLIAGIWRDGDEPRWVLASAVPLFDARGLDRVIVTFVDISVQRRAEESLRESEERYRTLAESSPEMIYLIDAEGRVQYLNAAAARQFGVPPERVAGRHLSELYPPTMAERHLRAVAGVIASGRSVATELMEQFPTGQRWIDARLSPLRNAKGETVAVLGLSEDITQRKRLAEELSRQQKLDALGVMAGGIAHDFNNLLGSVFGFVDLARAALGPDAPAARHLDKACLALERAGHLSHQLLTFSKGGEPRRRPVDVAALLGECVELALSGASLRCELSLPPGLWPLFADEQQLAQVFSNLLINARQAMPKGGQLHVRAENRRRTGSGPGPLPDGPYVVVAVADEGVGIPGELLEKIFDPFFTTKPQGSGLGLTIGYAIVQRHGGHVEVESLPGRGTTFSVWLPAAEGVAPAAEGPTPARAHQGQARILVMDDEPLIREMIARTLTSVGYAVTAVANGEEAIAAFVRARDERAPFALSLLDLTVPGGMGGDQVVQELGRLDPNLLACVTSGYATDAILANPQGYGFVARLAKPFRRAELLGMVETVLARRDVTPD